MKVYVEFYIGDNAHNIARKLRRRGFEAHVQNGMWVTVISEGEYNSTLNQIRRAVVATCPRAVPIDWGTLEQ